MILCVCPNPSIDTYSWLDQMIPGEVNRIIAQKEFPGGKGIHVALALKEINEPPCILGFWAGTTGGWIMEKCLSYSIPCYGPQVTGANRKCYTFRSSLDDAPFNNTELLEPGPEIKQEDYRLFIEDFGRMASKADFICLSGSWPYGSNTSGYQELIVKAREKNKRVILDASGAQLQQALKAKPFALHLNLKEAKDLYQTDDLDTILNLLSNSTELIALTLGKEGLYLKYKSMLLHASVNVQQVISTVGSGDCLTAGIAYALQHNLSLADIARWGVACGAANCLREDLGMLYKKDVNNLLGQINLRVVAS